MQTLNSNENQNSKCNYHSIDYAKFAVLQKRRKFKKKINLYQKVIQNNIGKKLVIQDNLETYYTTPDSSKIEKKKHSKFKIYTHINANCGACIENLKNWSKFSAEINKKNVEVIIICTSDDRFEILKYFVETNEKLNKLPKLYLDTSNTYTKKNKFMAMNENFETVLTKTDNTILLMGNPIVSTKIKELYLEKIK